MSLLVAQQLRREWDAGKLSRGDYLERLLKFMRPYNVRELLATMPEDVRDMTVAHLRSIAGVGPNEVLLRISATLLRPGTPTRSGPMTLSESQLYIRRIRALADQLP